MPGYLSQIAKRSVSSGAAADDQSNSLRVLPASSISHLFENFSNEILPENITPINNSGQIPATSPDEKTTIRPVIPPSVKILKPLPPAQTETSGHFESPSPGTSSYFHKLTGRTAPARRSIEKITQTEIQNQNTVINNFFPAAQPEKQTVETVSIENDKTIKPATVPPETKIFLQPGKNVEGSEKPRLIQRQPDNRSDSEKGKSAAVKTIFHESITELKPQESISPQKFTRTDPPVRRITIGRIHVEVVKPVAEHPPAKMHRVRAKDQVKVGPDFHKLHFGLGQL